MTTATLTHQPMPARKSAQDATQPAASHTTAVDQATQDAHDTRLLLTVSGVAVLIILVFFLGMMWWLSGYGANA